MVASVRVAEILSGIAEESTPIAALPQRLVVACARELEITGAAIVLMTDSGPAGTVAATDGPAEVMEELQFTLGEGPCVDSSTTGRPVLLSDLARTGPGRWPGFSAGALGAGIEAIFAFPLRVGGIRLGVLDLYRDRPGSLSEAELTEALSFADAATAILLHLQAQRPEEDSGSGSIAVLEDRAQVHQATGMIAVDANVPLAQALVLLRARAFAAERPILDLARDVVARTVRFTKDLDGGIHGH